MSNEKKREVRLSDLLSILVSITIYNSIVELTLRRSNWSYEGRNEIRAGDWVGEHCSGGKPVEQWLVPTPPIFISIQGIQRNNHCSRCHCGMMSAANNGCAYFHFWLRLVVIYLGSMTMAFLWQFLTILVWPSFRRRRSLFLWSFYHLEGFVDMDWAYHCLIPLFCHRALYS